MKRKSGFRYAVVKWLEKPYKNIDEYACVPASWIVLTRQNDRKVVVAYPVENPWDTEKRVKRRQRFPKDWFLYLALVIHDTDLYEDAQNFAKEMIDDDHHKHKSQDKNNQDKKMTQKKIRKSKRNNKNHETDVPQKSVLSTNDEKSRKSKRKRVTRKKEDAVKHMSNLIEPAESEYESEMKRKRFRYAVVQWLEKPYKSIEEYVCVPASWIKFTRRLDRRVIVAYPIEKPWDTEKRVKRRQIFSDDWALYLALVVYDTDSYKDALNFAKKMIDDDHHKHKSQDKKNRDKKMSQKKICKSKRNNKNHQTDVPQKSILSTNDEKSRKNKRKRVTRKKEDAAKHRSNLIEPAESESVSEFVSTSIQALTCTNENQVSILSSKNANLTIQKIPVETCNIVNRAEKSDDHESSSLERIENVKNKKVIKHRSNVIEPVESELVIEVVSSSSQALTCTNENHLSPALANSCTEKIPYENRVEKTAYFENCAQIRVSVIKHTSDYIDSNSVRSYGSVKKYILSRWH